MSISGRLNPDSAHPDRGTNCLECDSTIEPDRYICSFCTTALEIAAMEDMIR